MPLRAKTRSRKGRDLKRLDGLKRRVTRRRRYVRVQKQRGGAVAGIIDWLEAVSAMPLYRDKSGTTPDYSISEANYDELKLPPIDIATESAFKIQINQGYDDARKIAKRVRANLTSLQLLDVKHDSFAATVRTSLDTLTATDDAVDMLNYIADVEKSLRYAKESSDASAQYDTRTILTTPANYPLYIWALAYAAPEEEEITPALFSESETKRLVSETPGTVSSESIPKPAEPAGTAP